MIDVYPPASNRDYGDNVVPPPQVTSGSSPGAGLTRGQILALATGQDMP